MRITQRIYVVQLSMNQKKQECLNAAVDAVTAAVKRVEDAPAVKQKSAQAKNKNIVI